MEDRRRSARRGRCYTGFAMAKRTSKPKGKKVITPAFKREIEKARRDIARGKGISVGELLTKALERGAREHAA